MCWKYGRYKYDFVRDTSIHNGPSVGCPEYRRFSTCDGYPTTMIFNFMSNTDDACMSMFTKGQKQRILSALVEGGYRHSLLLSGSSQCIDNLNQDVAELRTKNVIELNLFPNPATDFLTVEFVSIDLFDFKIDVYNSSGQAIHTFSINTRENPEIQISTKNWTTGVYTLIAKGNEQQFSKSFFVEQ